MKKEIEQFIQGELSPLQWELLGFRIHMGHNYTFGAILKGLSSVLCQTFM